MRKNGNEKKKIKKYIFYILQLLFWIILIYSVAQIIKWNIHNKNNEELIEELSKNIIVLDGEQTETGEEEYVINFNALRNSNSDTAAFLKVNGTEIEYPVLKTTDNKFYLKHSFDKKYNAAGWIFADYKNQLDGSDKNVVIYGHNRKNGTMFSSLKNVLNKEWYENPENLKIQLITDYQDVVYDVFSIYEIKKESYYLQTDFNSDDEYLSFLETLKNRSIKDFGIEFTEKSKILTLSTCADDNNYRVVLHAKKSKITMQSMGM